MFQNDRTMTEAERVAHGLYQSLILSSRSPFKSAKERLENLDKVIGKMPLPAKFRISRTAASVAIDFKNDRWELSVIDRNSKHSFYYDKKGEYLSNERISLFLKDDKIVPLPAAEPAEAKLIVDRMLYSLQNKNIAQREP